MKRIISAVIAVVLCFCLMMPTVAFAAQTEESYASVAEYVAGVWKELGFNVTVDVVEVPGITIVSLPVESEPVEPELSPEPESVEPEPDPEPVLSPLEEPPVLVCPPQM